MDYTHVMNTSIKFAPYIERVFADDLRVNKSMSECYAISSVLK